MAAKAKKSAKKRATKSRKKSAAKGKAKAAAASGALSGYIVIDTTRTKARPASGKVGRTATLPTIKRKFGIPSDPSTDEDTSAGRKGHGRFVRVRPMAPNLDPADELGEKVVYLDPSGRVEFRQG